ncbi:MAG: hypothetical protein IT381_18150 [Deltaproteobacteria bacterium]|nr:hypothetical protein [Deltaproteobacteria bacterium]
MIRPADQLAAFRTREPEVADLLIRVAKSGGDPGLRALAAASGIAATDLCAILDADGVSPRPLGKLPPVVKDAAYGAVAAGATGRQFAFGGKAEIDATRLVSHAETIALKREVVAVLSQVLPPDAMRLLKGSELSLRVFASAQQTPSPRERDTFGEGRAALTAREHTSRSGLAGTYRYQLHEVTVRNIDDPPSLRTYITHEVMHALDWCVWDGKARSERADFQALFTPRRSRRSSKTPESSSGAARSSRPFTRTSLGERSWSFTG